MTNEHRLSRRMFLGGSIGVAGLASNMVAFSTSPQIAHASSAISNTSDKANINATKTGTADNTRQASHAITPPKTTTPPKPSAPTPTARLPFMNGDVDPKVNGFDPAKMLTDFDGGKVSKLPNGQTLRQYTIISTNKTIVVAPGQKFDAWVYNGRVPGPTIRATAGDHIRIHYINRSTMAHGIHFHGIHAGNVDAGFQSVIPGSEIFYEFDAQPVGVHLYHCHMSPLATHIHKGLYGFFIIDPPQPRPKALELAMMMNGFSFVINSEQTMNDLYAINTVAYHFLKHPIAVPVNQLVRIYLGGMVEFDRIFGFQLHSSLFKLFPTGTSLEPEELTDSVILCQGERAILEFSFPSPGQYLFRSPYSQAADKGFLGSFVVT